MSALQKSSQDQLRAYIEQIERLEEEKKALAADIREKFLEAKANGFDPKIMRKVLALRRLPANEREEMEQVLTVYLAAIEGSRSGDDTPLGRSWAGDGEEARP